MAFVPCSITVRQPFYYGGGWHATNSNVRLGNTSSCGASYDIRRYAVRRPLCRHPVTATQCIWYFNGFNAGQHGVTDPDGDGIYCATVQMHYWRSNRAFVFHGITLGRLWRRKSCTFTTGTFTNRSSRLPVTLPSPTVGWESLMPTVRALQVPTLRSA